MRKQRFRNLAMMLFASLVLMSASQAWAIIGTTAGTPVSNTASVNFTINSNTTSKTSNQVDFLVDRKIRPVVASLDTGNVYVVEGATEVYLSFSVTNNSNTASGSDYFYLTTQHGGAGTLDMTSVTPLEIWEDTDCSGDPDSELTGDNLVVDILNDAAPRCFMIVADTPTGGTAPDTDSFNLVATAWSGTTVISEALKEDNAVGTTVGVNDLDESEIVFADDATAGDFAADIVEDGKHSDLGTFELAEPISILKEVGDGASGYHLPGETVTYTITVSNSDLSFDASLVTISDNIAPEVVYNAGSLICPDISFDPEWFTAADSWAAADSSSATAVRCFEGDVLRSTDATMQFDVDIP